MSTRTITPTQSSAAFVKCHRFIFGRYSMPGLLLLLNAWSMTAPAQTPLSPPSAALNSGNDQGSELQLEVWQRPLAQVLKELSAKTATPIHYSVLPEGLITATCVGSSLKPVLECLLNHKADIIVRYEHPASNSSAPENNPIAEAWVLGAKLEAVPANGNCKADGAGGGISVNKRDENTAAATNKPSPSDHLVKIVQTGNAAERAQAISDLLAIGNQNDPQVKEVLEQAAHDPDPTVRAQAVSTLTHRDDYRDNAAEIIREALQDDSVDVRLMAVDGITDDVGLLQQAVNDNDETVNSLAKMKLEELMAKQKPK